MLAGRYHSCNLRNGLLVKAAVSALLFAKRHVVFYTTGIPPASLSYARGQRGLHGARVMLSVRIADPLSGTRTGS